MATADPTVFEGPTSPRASRAEGVAVVKPSWERPAFWALLAVAAVAFLWDLSESGYGNEFYSAAVQAGGESWKALFFGSSDAGNSITVDKPPASLWPMDISVRLCGRVQLPVQLHGNQHRRLPAALRNNHRLLRPLYLGDQCLCVPC